MVSKMILTFDVAMVTKFSQFLQNSSSAIAWKDYFSEKHSNYDYIISVNIKKQDFPKKVKSS